MVEGPHCRCTAYESEDCITPEDEDGCCSPQTFTSALLGVLACVLMMGGVFLAFHRWDPLWLIVSAIGVVLVLVGSVLHCCNTVYRKRRMRKSSAAKGCCDRVDHLHSHVVMGNGGTLTEQLLPIANGRRSVSQLSLNMLPGYFPPVMTTYGIEQHSAVVHNINRIIQQQQQQQQSPGNQGAGKSYILVSLPGEANAGNIQNLVTTVYQLDGNNLLTEVPQPDDLSTTTTSTTTTKTTSTLSQPPLKNVEVQTCSVWPQPSSPPITPSNVSRVILENSAIDIQLLRTNTMSTACGTTQTEDMATMPVNLMDCSNNLPLSICDNSSSCEQSTAICDLECVTPQSSDLPAETAQEDVLPVLLVLDVPISSDPLTESELVDVLVEIGNETAIPPVETHNDNSPNSEVANIEENTSEVLVTPSTEDVQILDVTTTEPSPDATSSHLESLSSPPTDNRDDIAAIAGPSNSIINSGFIPQVPNIIDPSDSLSDTDLEIDDNELMERSSPPPSYDDATHENESSIGAFGLAYGTI